MSPATPVSASANAAAYDALAGRYDDVMQAMPGDRWVRSAFQEFARVHLPPEGLVLDFGCGTGTDARALAGSGRRVLAFDTSPGMIAVLKQTCSREIDAGRVVPLQMDYESFVSGFEPVERPVAVTANFAVLDLIPNPSALFALFARLLPSGGVVIASVLNPFYFRDLVRGWRVRVPALRSGFVHLPGPGAGSFLHTTPRLRSLAQGFRLEKRLGLGTFVSFQAPSPAGGRWDEPRGLAERYDRLASGIWPLRGFGKYRFLLFRKIS